MIRLFSSVLVVSALALALAGCPSTMHKKTMRQAAENLEKDVKPRYFDYLDADESRPADLKANDKAALEDVISALDRAAGGAE